MRRLFKGLGYTTLAIAGLLGLAILFIYVRYPIVPPASDLVIEATPERVERGAYLFNHVAPCLDCHAERDWDLLAAPIVPGTAGKGAQFRWLVNEDLYAANITPHALADWTDGEMVRAITAGVDKDGNALYPLMPYDDYAKMPQEDIYAIVAYLRTLEPLAFTPPPPNGSVLINLIGRILPEPYHPPSPIDPADTIAYGEYLTAVASCAFCHGSDFSGGRLFRLPGGGAIRAANLTPDRETGLGNWNRESFIHAFKMLSDHQGNPVPVPEGRMNTPMPWIRFSGMTEGDLGAIYEYLRTLPPVAKNLRAMPTEGAP